MPFPYQPPTGRMGHREKRLLAAAAALIVAVFAGIGIWAAVQPGRYGPSHDGCVTVQMPSSTGGALIHDCGAQARAMCRDAFSHRDKLSLLTRPQCRLAGLGPPA